MFHSSSSQHLKGVLALRIPGNSLFHLLFCPFLLFCFVCFAITGLKVCCSMQPVRFSFSPPTFSNEDRSRLQAGPSWTIQDHPGPSSILFLSRAFLALNWPQTKFYSVWNAKVNEKNNSQYNLRCAVFFLNFSILSQLFTFGAVEGYCASRYLLVVWWWLIIVKGLQMFCSVLSAERRFQEGSLLTEIIGFVINLFFFCFQNFFLKTFIPTSKLSPMEV